MLVEHLMMYHAFQGKSRWVKEYVIKMLLDKENIEVISNDYHESLVEGCLNEKA